MTPFPRDDYAPLRPYDPGRTPVEVDLSDNTNLWGAHPDAMALVRVASSDTLARYPSVYGVELKEAVSRRFDVPAEAVTTGCGSDDLLDSVFRACAFPPGRMTYPAPSFSMVEIFARMNGMDSVAVPWPEAEADPRRLLVDDPDLLYLCRPNNPTGRSLPREWIMELLEEVGEEGPLVIVDEAYADFAGESLLGEAPATHRLLVLRTFSKLYGLAGLRVGFGVGPRALIREAEKSRGPYKVNHLAEKAAVAALEDVDGWAEGIRSSSIENRERLASELRKRGLEPLPSDANFLLVPLGRAGAREVNAALKERGVAARPFPDLPELGDALRVTVGPWEMMERFLGALDGLFAGDRRREGTG